MQDVNHKRTIPVLKVHHQFYCAAYRRHTRAQRVTEARSLTWRFWSIFMCA